MRFYLIFINYEYMFIFKFNLIRRIHLPYPPPTAVSDPASEKIN